MASHYHHHCHAAAPSAAATDRAFCYCHCFYVNCTPCQHHHPPPPLPDSYLHHPPNQPHPAPPHLPNLPQYPEHFQEHYFREGRQQHPTVSSLLRRIATLESALSRRSSHTSRSKSLRDSAARTIQAHFRAFLLRRSATLRQLKDLASTKSTLRILKSSVSEKTHFDYEVMHHKAMNLLLKLDTVQGGDPLIRNGKRYLSRELNEFLDFLEGHFVQSRPLSIGVDVRQSSNNAKSRVHNSERNSGNMESGCLRRVNVEKLRGLVERIDRLDEELDEEQNEVIKKPNNNHMIRNLEVPASRTRGLLKQHGGVQPKVKKNVSFVENGKVYRVLRRSSEPHLEKSSNDSVYRADFVVDDDDNDEDELEDELCREIDEIGVSSKKDVEDEVEEGSLIGSDGEKDWGVYSTAEGNYEMMRHGKDDSDDFIFSAASPVKMDSRGNLIDKRKKLNIV